MRIQQSVAVVCFFLLLPGCVSNFKVVKPDEETGMFGSTGQVADSVVSEKLELSNYRELLVVTAGSFFRDEMRLTEYFDEVIDGEELQQRLVRMGLSDEIPEIDGHLGMKRVADKLGPFLWLRYDRRSEGSRAVFGQLKVTDPTRAKDVHVAEVRFDYVWAGVTDENAWYPLLNATIKWIQDNSSGMTELPASSE